MKRKKDSGRILSGVCCAGYIIFMLVILYVEPFEGLSYTIIEVQRKGYWETVRSHTDFQLFESNFPLVNYVFFILLFIPAGILLPFYSKKYRRLLPFFLTSLLLVLFVGISRLLSLLGYFDADEILMNLLGCLYGWLIFKGIYGILRLYLKKK